MSLFDTVMTWLWLHKVPFFILLALTLWSGSMFLYFKRSIEQWFHRSRRHIWSVDLQRRISYRNGRVDTGTKVQLK